MMKWLMHLVLPAEGRKKGMLSSGMEGLDMSVEVAWRTGVLTLHGCCTALTCRLHDGLMLAVEVNVW